jgi:hypothetical protein
MRSLPLFEAQTKADRYGSVAPNKKVNEAVIYWGMRKERTLYYRVITEYEPGSLADFVCRNAYVLPEIWPPVIRRRGTWQLNNGRRYKDYKEKLKKKHIYRISITLGRRYKIWK